MCCGTLTLLPVRTHSAQREHTWSDPLSQYSRTSHVSVNCLPPPSSGDGLYSWPLCAEHTASYDLS